MTSRPKTSHVLRATMARMGASSLTIDTSPHDGGSSSHVVVTPIRTSGGGVGGSSPSLTMVDREAMREGADASRRQRSELRTVASRVLESPTSRLKPASTLSPTRRPRSPAATSMTSTGDLSMAKSEEDTWRPMTSPSRSLHDTHAHKDTGYIPGTSVHVPGYSYVAGRSFSRATRRALRRDASGHMLGEGIPSSPQAYNRIPNKGDNKPGHIPGYAGHVVGIRDQVGMSYSRGTAACSVDLSRKQGLNSQKGRKVMNAVSLRATQA